MMTKNELSRTHQLASEMEYYVLTLLDHSAGDMPISDIVEEIRRTFTFDTWAKGLYYNGKPRWENIIYLFSIDLDKGGFLTKNKGTWIITDKGRQAVNNLTPAELFCQANDAYKTWKENRDSGTAQPVTVTASTMSDRLAEIIAYKTGGKQTAFADIMGWTPQYLAKLLRGDNFGLSPVMSLLSRFSEINARWLLFGEGVMLDDARLDDIQRKNVSMICQLLDLGRFLPVMTGEELRQYEEAVRDRRTPQYSADSLTDMKRRAIEREGEIESRVRDAMTESDKMIEGKGN